MTGAARRLFAPAAAALVVEIALVSLGVWQLHRLAWKEALIARIEARASAPPRPLPPPSAWPSLGPAEIEFRHVAVDGTFDHAAETLILRASDDGAVFHVITPLRLAGGGTVLIDRGAVPADRKARQSRSAGEVAGPVHLTGVIRAPEGRNPFTPADRDGTFYTRDPAAIAAYHHLADAAPFSIDADPSMTNPGGLPKPGGAALDIPNNHLSYALTWFGLALALAGVFGVFGWRRLSRAPSAIAHAPTKAAMAGAEPPPARSSIVEHTS